MAQNWILRRWLAQCPFLVAVRSAAAWRPRMMILLAALSAFSSSPGGEFPEARRFEGELPVRLWMSNDRRYRAGDRVRLQVDADVDGFLLVLNLDPDGRLRVLFPLDPRDDTRIQAGRRYEVRSESSDAAFRA